MVVAVENCCDGRLVVLPTEVGVAEQIVGALVVGKQPHQLGVVREDACRFAFHPGIERQHDLAFAFADLSGERRRARDRLDELLGRAGRVGEAEIPEGEVRSFAAACS